MAGQSYAGWEKLKTLGEGGQSQVFLVRNPERVNTKRECLEAMRTASKTDAWEKFAEACALHSRPDLDSELGALKQFKSRRGGSKSGILEQEARRFRNEIHVLSQGHRGLPKLLDTDENGFWLVTEFFRQGSLDGQIGKFRNQAMQSLEAFKPLVETVAKLHEEGIVHRDIKPHNVFLRDGGSLALGDLGIVFIPDADMRVTLALERVGPWEYMAPWADTGERIDEVRPSADVYMLGKLLWCMVSGRLRLPREDRRERAFDLIKLFSSAPEMEYINLILDQCVVPKEHLCLASATDLLAVIDEALQNMKQANNRFLANGHLSLTCLVCGKGVYKLYPVRLQIAQWGGSQTVMHPIFVQPHICTVCTHYAFFAPGYPDEAEKRGWKLQ